MNCGQEHLGDTIIKSEGTMNMCQWTFYLEWTEDVYFAKSFENPQDFPTFLEISGGWIHLYMNSAQAQPLSGRHRCRHYCIVVWTDTKEVQCHRGIIMVEVKKWKMCEKLLWWATPVAWEDQTRSLWMHRIHFIHFDLHDNTYHKQPWIGNVSLIRISSDFNMASVVQCICSW